MNDLISLPGMRWIILRTCLVAGHIGATETMLIEVLRSEYMTCTRKIIRDELHYLEQRKLITIIRSELNPWQVRLSRYGYDVAQYQVDCDAGINRPPHPL